jgi:cyclopropane fatty-acyl-phospholipid synthase-like methyltransferase
LRDLDKQTEFLVALHQGLRRLWSGGAACTLKALALCPDLLPAPNILDIGCGNGASSLVLASVTNGRIFATDLFAAFLGQLRERAAAMGQAKRIQTVTADMHRLPFRAGSFDRIWSEGAAYVMGFDEALATWRSLAREGGYLVVSELSWFRPGPAWEAFTCRKRRGTVTKHRWRVAFRSSGGCMPGIRMPGQWRT